MQSYFYVVFILFSLNLIECVPLSNDELVSYVAKYGYSGDKEMKTMTTKEKENAIKDFQKNFFLPVTGEINAETELIVNRPRCGRPDGHFAEAKTRNKIRKWPTSTVTYKLINNPKNGLSKSTTLKEISKSFDIWAEYVPLKFEDKAKGKVDIELTFNPADEGDGPGNTLAYAYFPPIGDVFFDDEDWTIKSKKGVNLLTTAAHEIGHSLGLSHSEHKQALMYPYISTYDPNFTLHYDDINRIQQIYGMKNINAAFITSNEFLYLIRGDKCFKYKNKRLEPDYPKLITTEWAGLPSSIDAAYNYGKKIYFLKDGKAWVYDGTMKQYESDILDKNLDAALTIDNRLYIFSGSKYWKYNSLDGKVKMQNGFPKEISSFWKGVPSSIDAAYYDKDEYIYFFKDNLVYTFEKSKRDQDATSQTISDWLQNETNN